MKNLSLLIRHFFSFVFYFRFFKLWDLKTYLYKNRLKSGFMFQCAVYNFEYRLRKKGSWIGYTADFSDMPTFPHGITGVFVSGGGEIGQKCIIYQQVTIGSNLLKNSPYYGSPTIGNNVLIGAGAKIIGKITIGDNCRIGANAVVVRDLKPNSVAVCETRIIEKNAIGDNGLFKATLISNESRTEN